MFQTMTDHAAGCGERSAGTPSSAGVPALRLIVCVAAVCLLPGCGGDSDRAAESPSASRDATPVKVADNSVEYPMTADELRMKLKANGRARFRKAGNEFVAAELFESGVKSIEALRGLPLRYLDLGMTDVSDLSPLAGMPLTELILEQTPVTDIRVLKGMPLEGLKLQDTKITDVSVIHDMPLKQLNLRGIPVEDATAFARMPLNTLWLPRTKISDLSPLAALKLESLDIESTAVKSLDPLAGMTTLLRLNIAETAVEDLTPLKDLKLERLTFTPSRIKTGMDMLRKMTSLGEIRVNIEEEMSATEFWKRYDIGAFNTIAEETGSATEKKTATATGSPTEPGSATETKDGKADAVPVSP